MKTVDELTKKEIIDLLGRCWMTHDGMWFYQTMQAFGIAEANRLNKGAIAMLAPLEIGRMKKVFGLEKETIETFGELAEFFERASTLFVPDFMNATFSFPRRKTPSAGSSSRKAALPTRGYRGSGLSNNTSAA